jgi:hypothetical protein
VIQQGRDNVADLAEDKPALSAWISWLVGMVKWRLSRASVSTAEEQQQFRRVLF